MTIRAGLALSPDKWRGSDLEPESNLDVSPARRLEATALITTHSETSKKKMKLRSEYYHIEDRDIDVVEKLKRI